MRLIDIEAPCKIEIELDGEKCHATVTAPTIDAVQVVRCKDCRYRGKELCLMYYVDEGGFGYDLTRDSDYCVFGERKDDEEQV